METKSISVEKKDWLSITSLCLGVISIFFWEFSIFPLLAIIFGILGLIRHQNKKIALAGIILGIVYLALAFAHTYYAPPRPPVTVTYDPPLQPKGKETTITNPDYLKNPSAYVVDQENKVSPDTADKPLWVEEVVDSHTVKISYVMETAGQKILKVETRSIPWLRGYNNQKDESSLGRALPNSDCWDSGTKQFLNDKFLHTTVYLMKSEWSGKNDLALMFGDVPAGSGSGRTVYQPLVDYIVGSGYGLAELPSHSTLYDPATSKYYTSLKDIQGVASLKELGLWKTCK